ncbi:4'-phosphopantetheinyl transferase family protein [Humidesulfovibrio mexicanus]|uniref:4'-phosphopantetheinyl transferase family protein n=1 Tax=Humidesulfovibrio mexicanus TaxID=147047 RepID=UPI000B7990D6
MLLDNTISIYTSTIASGVTFPRTAGGAQHDTGWDYPAWVVLSVEERQRMSRFVRFDDALLYCAAHSLKRQALSLHFPAIAPSEWRFSHEGNGKPVIANAVASDTIHFSLSHSWPVAAVAISRVRPCGVDVETEAGAPKNLDGMDAALHPAEQACLRDATDKRSCFLDLWTRKEAAAKALGCGLAWEFSSFHVCPRCGCVLCADGSPASVCARSVPFRPGVSLAVGWIGLVNDVLDIQTRCADANMLAPRPTGTRRPRPANGGPNGRSFAEAMERRQ